MEKVYLNLYLCCCNYFFFRSILIDSVFFATVLEPYKYAGYPMLIKTMELEVADSTLFAKETPLLPHCLEVVYHTLNCSALNVEELRREKGNCTLRFIFVSHY